MVSGSSSAIWCNVLLVTAAIWITVLVFRHLYGWSVASWYFQFSTRRPSNLIHHKSFVIWVTPSDTIIAKLCYHCFIGYDYWIMINWQVSFGKIAPESFTFTFTLYGDNRFFKPRPMLLSTLAGWAIIYSDHFSKLARKLPMHNISKIGSPSQYNQLFSGYTCRLFSVTNWNSCPMIMKLGR